MSPNSLASHKSVLASASVVCHLLKGVAGLKRFDRVAMASSQPMALFAGGSSSLCSSMSGCRSPSMQMMAFSTSSARFYPARKPSTPLVARPGPIRYCCVGLSGKASGNDNEVSFTALEDGTKEDFDLMCRVYSEATTGPKLAKRSLDLLLGLKGEEFKLTAKVDMFEHSIQTATRAMRDGADEETIVCCLLHDIGELMSPSNHGEVASGLLRPYISPANAWTLENHEVFQGYYYYHHVGGDRNTREVFKDHEFYQRTVDFCHKWDQPSFDPDYKSESLDVFVPMVERIFARRPFFWDLTHPKACAVVAGGSNKNE